MAHHREPYCAPPVKEEGACENRGGIGFFRTIFDLVKHIKHLRKSDFLEKPHFEDFNKKSAKAMMRNSSKIKIFAKKLGGFAKNDYLCT